MDASSSTSSSSKCEKIDAPAASQLLPSNFEDGFRDGDGDEKLGMEVIRAAMDGNVQIFEEPNLSDKHFFSKTIEDNNILHLAVRYRQTKFVQAFLERYFGINKKLITESNSHGNTPLHVAAAEVGNTDIVKVLYEYLEKSVDEGEEEKPWRAQNSDGNTALHLALLRDNYYVAQFLVRRDGGLAGILNHSQEAPLHLAITHLSIGCIELTRDLLEKERCVATWRDAKGLTPLLRAAASRRLFDILDVTKKIIDVCPESTLLCDASSNSFLHLLIHNKVFDVHQTDIDNLSNHKDIEDLICLKEIQILKNNQNEDGDTPIHLAAKYKNIDMMRSLRFKCSANIFIRNNDGISVDDMIQQNHLLNEPPRMTREEYNMAYKGDIKSLQKGIQTSHRKRQLLRSRDSTTGSNFLHLLMNTTAINHHFSSRDNYGQILDLFKADYSTILPELLCQVDQSGDTPTHILVRSKPSRADPELEESSMFMLQQLLKRCIMVFVRSYTEKSDRPWVKQNAKGNTPLHEAIIANNKLLVLELLNWCQESTQLVNKHKETPLHVLAGSHFGMEEFTNEEIMEMVDANFEALELRDKDGLIPILRALKAANLNMVVTLLSNGQKFNDIDGQMFLHLLIKHPSNDFVHKFLGTEAFRKMLLELKDKDGDSPFHLAMKEKCFGFIENILQIYGRKRELFEGEQLVDNQWLLDLIRKPDNEGLTPILRAIKVDNLKLAIALCHEAPKAACVGDSDGKTFWHLLIKHPLYNIEDVKDLLKNVELREILKQKDKDGVTPLHLAIKEKCFNFVQVLLETWGDESETSKGNQWPMNLLLKIANNVGETPEDLLADVPTLSLELEKKLLTDRRMRGIRSSWRIPRTQLQNYMNSMNVIAALQTTITFTAAFTVPGGLIQDLGTPLLIRSIAFQMFMISDVIAMCLSMMVLICLLWMVATDKRKSVMIQDFAVTLLLASFVATLITFMAGVYATIFPVKRWIAIVTLVLCSFLMLLIHRFMVTNLLLPFKNATSNFVQMLLSPAIKTIKILKGDESKRNIV